MHRRNLRGENSSAGFTLIEVIVVIAILGILAGITVFAVTGLTSTSAQGACKSDYNTVEAAVEEYKAQMGAYPLGGGTQSAGTTVSSTTATDTGSKTSPAFTSGVAPSGENAATSTGALMTGSNVLTAAPYKDSNGTATENLDSPTGTAGTSTGAIGPWLREVPTNAGHYTIWAANDGSGQIAVLNSKSVVVAGTSAAYNDITACSAVS